MASFTLGTAAAATGTAKSTILRAIRAGRISATRDDLGQWMIDPAELNRCFPLLAIPGTEGVVKSPETHTQPAADHDATTTTDVLVSELRTMLADLRRDRDHWREAHERGQAALSEALAQRLLPPPVEQDAPSDTPPVEQDATGIEQHAPPKRRWWQRA